MKQPIEKPSGQPSGRAWPLYAAAFTTALSLNTCWTAMPFVISGIGGNKVDVGNALAVNSLAYLVALLLTGSLLGHLEVKRTPAAAPRGSGRSSQPAGSAAPLWRCIGLS